MKTPIYYNIFMFAARCCQKRLDEQVAREALGKVENVLHCIAISRLDISDQLRNSLNEKH